MRAVVSTLIGAFLGAIVGYAAPLVWSIAIRRENNPQIGLVSVFLAAR